LALPVVTATQPAPGRTALRSTDLHHSLHAGADERRGLSLRPRERSQHAAVSRRTQLLRFHAQLLIALGKQNHRYRESRGPVLPHASTHSPPTSCLVARFLTLYI